MTTLWYPSYVYNKDKEVTKENKRLYDLKQRKLDEKCIEINPDYDNLSYAEKFKIRRKAEEILVW